MRDTKKSDKRSVSFWKSDPPLTSKRVSIILSNPKDSENFVKAVRESRYNKKASFKISDSTIKRIKKAK
jgi:hypothetical protein